MARASGKTCNALVREALALFLNHAGTGQWPREVMEFQGVKDFPPFEDHRNELPPPREDLLV
ncbi:MAG: hypothetical protein HQL76_15890 [Magnetococcales bacterium]|nr:hypothetical protein [Magnetococcales bacterium]